MTLQESSLHSILFELEQLERNGQLPWQLESAYADYLEANKHCEFPACKGGDLHLSDCAVHNGPALPTGWQPIEKAPQETAVDLWCKSTHHKDYGRRVTRVCLVGDTWYGPGLPDVALGEYASHWMPLPKAPT
jgi:hypothetical protein